MAIEPVKVSITTTGGNGASTGAGTTSEILNGLLVGVYLITGSAPATTDWVFTDAALGITLFTLTNINTAGFYSPLAQGVTNAAGVAISGAGVVLPVVGRITCTIAQANDGTYSVIYFVQSR